MADDIGKRARKNGVFGGGGDCWQEHRCDICGASWEDAIAALRALPVEQRMEAMGMVAYGEVWWDGEEERDTISPLVDVTPGCTVYVEEVWVGE